MALPVSRNRTYSVGSPVVAADLNDVQDQIIAHDLSLARHEAGKRSSVRRKLPMSMGRCTGGGPGTFFADGSFTTSTAADIFLVALPLVTGERLLEVRARVDPAATGIVTATVFRATDGSTSSLAAGVSAGGAIQTITTAAMTELVVDNPGIGYVVIFTFTLAGGHVLLAGDYRVDFP
jgi:hypothetical protein